MGTIRKKVLAVCMTVLLALLGMTVSAARQSEAGNEENIETVSGGDAAGEQVMPYAADIASGMDGGIMWTIDASGKLTVSGTGDLSGDHSHSNSDFAWRPYSSQITSAEINVTGMTNASYLFSGCVNMTSITMSGFDTSSITNMKEMFGDCRSLVSLDVSGFNTSSVTSMDGMFRQCNSLTHLSLGNFNTVNVADMEYMFCGCNSLVSLDISSFSTANVTNMANMFYGCDALLNLDVSSFDTRNVTNMSHMFECCRNLTSLDVSNFDTRNVTDMLYMFDDCSGLTSLNISNFDTVSVTDMDNMFAGCSGLVNLDISGFNTRNVIYMQSMFYNCSSLINLDVSNFDTGNVTSMWEMFAGCNGLTNLDVSNFVTNNVTSMGEMFFACSGLENLDLSGFNTSNVVDMRSMFSACSSLTGLNLSGFDTANVTEATNMLAGCYGLTAMQCPTNLLQSVALPLVSGTTWSLPDGTEITELPQGVSASVTLTRSGTPDAPGIITTTPDLNMSDVIRVKYVPYSYTVETNNMDPYNTIEFSIVEGRLADGLQMHPATGEIYGVPTEAGEFKITVMAVYSNPAYLPSYAELTLTVLDNTDGNVGVATDPGYNITQPVTGFNVENIAGSGTQTLVSQGEYSQFRDVYIDGKKLTAGQDYTSEAGSTRITIMNQTLADGGTGTHTLGIEFRTETGSLKRAAQNYVISSNTNAGNNTGNNGNSNNSGNNSNNNNSNSGNSNNSSNILPVSAELPLQDFVIYTVERGDSLWDIAVKFYGKGESWRKIYQDNAAVIKNPNRLYAGQKLVIRLTVAVVASPVPETTVSTTEGVTVEGTAYRVQKGDMLWSIAQKAYGDGKLWKIIYEANKGIIKNPGIIREGQVLNIPQR